MANAWGASWGAHWGSSWGSVTSAPTTGPLGGGPLPAPYTPDAVSYTPLEQRDVDALFPPAPVVASPRVVAAPIASLPPAVLFALIDWMDE